MSIMKLELKQLSEQDLNSHRTTPPIQDTLPNLLWVNKKILGQFVHYFDKEETVDTKSLTEQVLKKTQTSKQKACLKPLASFI